MSSRYAVNTIESLSPRRPYPLATGRFRQLEIHGAVPVVRRAILIKHRPLLRKRQTRTAANILKRLWPEWQHDYVAKMAQISGIPARDLTVAANEKVRYRYDGETPMVDLPRIRTASDASYQLDQRNCVALCIDEYSSKVWTRIGLPENSSGCSLEELRELTERYRRQAADAGEWFYEEFFRLTDDAFRGTRRTRNAAILEVTTVGLRVDSDSTYDEFDSWLFDGDTANLANEELCEFLAAAANVDSDIAKLVEKERESYWLALPTTVQARTGLILPRRILYLNRVVGDVVQIVGIGLDDSGSGDLANDVALQLSRLIANWI